MIILLLLLIHHHHHHHLLLLPDLPDLAAGQRQRQERKEKEEMKGTQEGEKKKEEEIQVGIGIGHLWASHWLGLGRRLLDRRLSDFPAGMGYRCSRYIYIYIYICLDMLDRVLFCWCFRVRTCTVPPCGCVWLIGQQRASIEKTGSIKSRDPIDYASHVCSGKNLQ